jgi:hypothetical protein
MTNEELWHFSGKYRGIFKTHAAGTTHAAAFHDLILIALEIRDVKRIPNRDVSKEKIADFHYESVIRPKKKWGIGGVDISIISQEKVAFSEKIHDVILLDQSENRMGFSPLRKFQLQRSTEQEFILQGIIYFSLPSIQPKVDPISTTTTNTAADTANYNHLLPDAENIRPIISSDTTSSEHLSRQRGCFTLPGTRSGCLNAGGCMGGILKLLRWAISAMIILGLISYLSKFLSSKVSVQKNDKKEGVVESSDLRLDPLQDTMSVQPWNYLVDHDIKWSDFLENEFHSKYTTNTKNLKGSSQRHEAWAVSAVTDELLFYHDLYHDLYSGDSNKLDSLVDYFRYQRQIKNLDPSATAEMVITFVQEIPYVLIHDGSCKDVCAEGGFMAEYHAQGKPCVPNVVAGVYSPYEFIHTLDGDCDTRSLLAYSILDKLGFGASIWVSREYGHSILGVAVPSNSANYKSIKGVRYFAVELTAKGFRLGMIAPEHTEMNNWNVVLYNR